MNYITALPLRMLFIVSLVSREKFLDKISRHNLLLFSERLNSELGFMKEHFYFSNFKCSLFFFRALKFKRLFRGFTLIISSEGWLAGTEVWWKSSVLYSSRSPTTRYNPQLGFYAFALDTEHQCTIVHRGVWNTFVPPFTSSPNTAL